MNERENKREIPPMEDNNNEEIEASMEAQFEAYTEADAADLDRIVQEMHVLRNILEEKEVQRRRLRRKLKMQ